MESVKKSIITIIITVMAVAGCQKTDIDDPMLTPGEILLTAAAPQAISSSNEFGIQLFSKVAGELSANMMLSPLSVSTALSMLLNGCEGATLDQLKETLRYPPAMRLSDINEAYNSLVTQILSADPKVTFSLANAIFYRQGFAVKVPFLNTMTNDYKAKTEGLNFGLPSALTAINGWASNNTNGKIPKVLDEISADAVMFIMNALYFKGEWSYQFDKSKTTNRPFNVTGGNPISVSTMNGEVGARMAAGQGYRAIEMPYGRTNFTMSVVVPDGPLGDFTSSFTAAKWKAITEAFDQTDEFGKIIVYMPKFKFSYEKYLNQQLQSMGMIDAFDESLADLSGIADASIFVSFVKQNTFVAVDEEGTEAAAVTTIGIELTSMPSQPKQFIIDKPFLFAIRERTTNTLLFIGQVTDPSAE
jgi:serpin B